MPLGGLLGVLFGGGAPPPGRSERLQVAPKHFVLGTPVQAPFPEGVESVVFGTGCFWGTEKGFWRLPGVFATSVGYCAGATPNPTYNEVCSGATGHNEVVRVAYDPAKVSFTDLLRNFWQSHDPTQGNGQGNDRGTQYRSGIYFSSPAQQALAEASKASYEADLGRPVTTEIIPAPEFYFAEDYHQQYLAKPGNRQYCSAQPTGQKLAAYDGWAPSAEALGGADPAVHAPKLPEGFWEEHGPRPGCTIGFPNEQVVL